jgi:hypothetical protein
MKKKTKKTLGLWQKPSGLWYYRKQTGGNRASIPLNTKDYAEAVSMALKIKDTESINYKGSVESALSEFIKFKVSSGAYSSFSEGEKKGLLLQFAKHVGLKLPVQTLTPKHIRSFFELKQSCAESTKSGYKATLQSFFTWCIEEKKLFLQECKRALQGFKFQTCARKDYLNLQEVQTLINSCTDEETTFIVICGAFLGMRKNEIIHSRKNWFEFDAGVPVCFIQNLDKASASKMGLDPFRIKNGKERRVPINSCVLDWLKKFVSHREQYCIAPKKRAGKTRYRYNFDKKFIGLVSRVFPDKGIGSHTLRHSFATNLAINNTAIGFIAQYLGDSVRTTEKHYAQFLPTVTSVDVMKIDFKPAQKQLEAA